MGMLLGLQLRRWARDRGVLAGLLAMALALAGAAAWATAQDISRQEAAHAAAATARAQWEGKGAAHPHRMSHFGDFAFRPSGPLARLDRGVQARLGKVLRIEGHRQNTPLQADRARAGTLARFDTPDAAFLLQVVVPLLMVFLGAGGLAADRASGRLKLLLVQGARARQVAGAQLLALWGLGVGGLLIVVAASWASSAVLGASPSPAGPRVLGFILSHAIFLAVVSTGVVAATLWLRSARSALLALLAAWVVGTALLPRMTGSLASVLLPLPSQDAFQAALRTAREAGPDGHNEADAVVERRKQELMAEHGVETVDALPLNFGGIAMQLDEDFGNQVWDEHYGQLQARLAQQSRIATGLALLNPFQAIDHVSMALAGTDLAHDLDFQAQAEAYRRTLIRALNHEHAYGGSTSSDRDWTAPAGFYAGLSPFSYTAPSCSTALQPRWLELLALCVWAVALGLMLWRGASLLDRGRLPC